MAWAPSSGALAELMPKEEARPAMTTLENVRAIKEAAPWVPAWFVAGVDKNAASLNDARGALRAVKSDLDPNPLAQTNRLG